MYELIIEELNDLLHCNHNCDNCKCQRQDEGDKNPWCGFESVLRKAITCIEQLNKIEE